MNLEGVDQVLRTRAVDKDQGLRPIGTGKALPMSNLGNPGLCADVDNV